MSSISPYPEGVSGGNPGERDGDRSEAPNPGGGYGSGSAEGYPPGPTSSGSAAFAAPPPGAQQAYGGPAPQQGHQAPPGGYGSPQPNPGYGPGYGQPPTHPQSPPPPPPAYPPHPGQSPQQPPPPPGSQQQMPPAPYASGPEPARDMPMAGRSPIRRNIDDTAELPAFLDSAMSDESPNRDLTTPERGTTRKFPLTTGFTALLRHRHALSVLVRRDLAVKYQSTAMGYLWSLIEPLGLALIYWLIFGVIFGREGDIPNGAGYALYIVAGVFAWQWFSTAMNQGANSLGGQSSLITVMKVPREVFPISKVFARFAEYVVGFPILVAVAIAFGGTFKLNLLWLFPSILLQAIMLTGIVFILAAANVLFKDVQRFLSLIMRVVFYSSAIIYPLKKVSEAMAHHDLDWVYTAFTYNPLVVLFQMHRAVWIPGLTPEWPQIAWAFGFSIVLMFFGRWIFYKLEPQVLKAL